VSTCPGNEIPIGSKMAGVMGGMGLNRPGSYGEFVAVPATNAVPIETGLPWEGLVALPEFYWTAYSCLFTVLDLKKDETLLIRGATSTIGQAALNLAVHAGARFTVDNEA
jgi:NADPH:quinone reductase